MPKKPVDRILFNTNYYELGEVKYAQGKHYPVTPETQTRVKAGDAEPVTVEMDVADATAEDGEAKAKLERERQATAEAEAEKKRLEAEATEGADKKKTK
jgi:hypothetical protein